MKKKPQKFISTISSHKIIETILMIHTKKNEYILFFIPHIYTLLFPHFQDDIIIIHFV